MGKIFISYRRADSQYVTDSIYGFLKNHFGADNVFLDVGSIPFGVDFRAYLRDQIEAHDVVLVIIGTEWERIMAERADQANDFVRIEIENALQQGKLVLPVLVKGASMPDFANLPESISELQWRNSAVVQREPYFSMDCQRIADGIDHYLASQAKPKTTAKKEPPPQIKEKATSKTAPIATKEDKSQPKISVEETTPEPKIAEIILPDMSEILPQPFDWCVIPAGEFLYGGDNQKLTLPAFAMAKYPITYSQFQVFIDDKDGITDKRWWQGLAQEFKDPFEQNWKVADHPREMVNWYQAMAFCRWLSWKLDGGYAIDDVAEWRVRLPTEFEWEKAARGAKGLMYPYGKRFGKTKSNIDKSSINATTPVTQYPRGTSPYGVLDMSGNVWEWCLTDYSRPKVDVRLENVTSKSSRVLRGGSFYNNYDSARTVSRISYVPNFGFDRCGFRICIPSLD